MPEADDGRAVLLAGAQAYQRGDVAGALRIFSDAVRDTTGPLRVSALINAASMADELGDHTTALGWYREALAEIPADAVEKRCSALVNQSQALQHLGELDAAQAALEEARGLLANSAEELGTLRVSCLLSLGAVAFHRGQWAHTIEIATESLETAVRFAPQLAGHPLMNLAGAYFETGRHELAFDFARQGLAAFEAAGDVNGVAESRQNVAIMHIRLGQHDAAAPLLRASQDYFERAGLGYRAGVGLKNLGAMAEGNDDLAEAEDLYTRALTYFRDSGAVLDAAFVRTRLATVAYDSGDIEVGEDHFAEAFAVYAERGLGLHCAQIDFWHALLLESILDAVEDPTAALALATDLAVTSALAIDAVRHTLPTGAQRHQWTRQIADPALQLAFRLAYRRGDGLLLADLIETQCAGATLQPATTSPPGRRQFPLELLDPTLASETADTATLSEASTSPGPEGTGATGTENTDRAGLSSTDLSNSSHAESTSSSAPQPTLQAGPLPATAGAPPPATLRLASALADIAAGEGLPITLPPRLLVGPEQRLALADFITAAEQRYGRPIRDTREVSA
ncbi:tetratricopeptide repeat protein [Nocardia sp. NPDC127579]|uniref:tetratricopeptide repeat protein n=1 Tax=Nocardia sp. NPDC127579 TaxID=3345402 RepID=UPI0036391DE6